MIKNQDGVWECWSLQFSDGDLLNAGGFPKIFESRSMARKMAIYYLRNGVGKPRPVKVRVEVIGK